MATVNKQAIAAAFGRAASQYEQHAELQRQSADALLAMLPQRQYARVLDAGCGRGWMSRRWRERSAQVTALDLSPLMLVQARQQDAAHHYLTGISNPYRWRTRRLISRGATLPCNGALNYLRHYASFIG